MEGRPFLRPLQPPHPFEGKTSIYDCHYSPSLLYPQSLSPFFLLDPLQRSLFSLHSPPPLLALPWFILWRQGYQQQRLSHPAGSSCSRLCCPTSEKPPPTPVSVVSSRWIGTDCQAVDYPFTHITESHPCCPQSPNYRFVCCFRGKNLWGLLLCDGKLSQECTTNS